LADSWRWCREHVIVCAASALTGASWLIAGPRPVVLGCTVLAVLVALIRFRTNLQAQATVLLLVSVVQATYFAIHDPQSVTALMVVALEWGCLAAVASRRAKEGWLWVLVALNIGLLAAYVVPYGVVYAGFGLLYATLLFPFALGTTGTVLAAVSAARSRVASRP